MDKRLKTKQEKRERRQVKVRARISGSKDCPRLNVYKSLTSIYAQLIDDTNGKVLVAANSKNLDTKGDVGERKGKVAVSYLVGKDLAIKAKVAGVSKVVFDRGGFRYQGRVQAVAEGAREGGLIF